MVKLKKKRQIRIFRKVKNKKTGNYYWRDFISRFISQNLLPWDPTISIHEVQPVSNHFLVLKKEPIKL